MLKFSRHCACTVRGVIYSNLWSIREKIIKVQFSSECKVRVFADCLKNPNKVLKCIFKSSWVRQILGTLQETNPARVGKYKNFEIHNKQSPHISPGSPPSGKPMTSALSMRHFCGHERQGRRAGLHRVLRFWRQN